MGDSLAPGELAAAESVLDEGATVTGDDGGFVVAGGVGETGVRALSELVLVGVIGAGFEEAVARGVVGSLMTGAHSGPVG